MWRITLLDRIFGNCEKGIHKFQGFLVSDKLPSELDIANLHIKGDVESVLGAIKNKIYEIRCVRCGQKPE